MARLKCKCGGDAVLLQLHGCWFVACKKDHSHTQKLAYDTPQEAVEAWRKELTNGN